MEVLAPVPLSGDASGSHGLTWSFSMSCFQNAISGLYSVWSQRNCSVCWWQLRWGC